MTQFAERIVELRKGRDLTQQSLADTLGVSQATVSRFESGDTYPSDIRQLSKLAKSLDIALSELLELMPPEFNQGSDNGTPFFAFCSNPLCESNELIRENNQNYVRWKSGKQHQAAAFDEINFCESCGEELKKESFVSNAVNRFTNDPQPMNGNRSGGFWIVANRK
jgi:transcriptional regulator with XRE-family HTH domain